MHNIYNIPNLRNVSHSYPLHGHPYLHHRRVYMLHGFIHVDFYEGEGDVDDGADPMMTAAVHEDTSG
jgi:hypothetical protein